MRAWLTPDEIPTSRRHVLLTIPDSAEFRAALSGALLLLTYPCNWEKFGDVTKNEAADCWLNVLLEAEDSPMVGTIFWFAGETAPAYALVCDGAEYRTSDYPKLGALLSDIYGEASPGYFRVPDLRARVGVGLGERDGYNPGALGDGGGSPTVTLTTSQMPQHKHEIPKPSIGIAAAPGELVVYTPSLFESQFTSNEGGGQPHDNMPPYLCLLPCIVAK